MNEFTKEELILLACWSVNRCLKIGLEQAKDEGTIALSHKLQDIIINYCEHDMQALTTFTDICTKCGEIF
jgi:hypothetical protein